MSAFDLDSGVVHAAGHILLRNTASWDTVI